MKNGLTTRHRRRAIGSLLLLVLAAVMLGSTSIAEATTVLMVNGDTPARYFQRVVDHFAANVPTPPGIVDLYLRPCPGTPEYIGGCAEFSTPAGRPAIYLAPSRVGTGANFREALAHELGHLEIDGIDGVFRDPDRARFRMLWRRPPQLGWWDPIASCGAGLVFDYVFPGGVRCGRWSSAAEWAADAYKTCATAEWRLNNSADMGDMLPDFGWSESAWRDDLRLTRAPYVASCVLIRSAAERARALASTAT